MDDIKSLYFFKMEEEEMDLLKKEHSGADEEDKQVPLNYGF